jgi:RimJ/RimL family protein N-acetyltransferase
MDTSQTRFTDRLRLEPIGQRHARDLWRMHQDDRIAEWYGGRWSMSHAERMAAKFEQSWASDGVSKWIAYHRDTGALVGRGGCSRTILDGEACIEIGWAIRDAFLRQGYATEIGREALAVAFDVLHAQGVAAFTEVHNRASRAVMERLGMRYDKEIVAEGLVEGRDGIHPDARFAVYRIARGATMEP